MKRARADALILGENTRFGAERQRIVDLAIRYRLPMIVAAKEYAEAGGWRATAPTTLICSAVPPCMSTRSSQARSPPTCPSSSPPSSSW
jgi:hypothetical protein